MSMALIMVLTLALLIVLLVVLKFNAALSFLISSVACALMAGMDFAKIGPSVVAGFGAYSGSIGLLIALGVIFSGLLERSGALEELGNWISSRFSANTSLIVIMVVSFIIAIPVFFTAALLVLAPLAMKLAKKYKQSNLAYGIAVFNGLSLGTNLVPPTPAPLAASQALGAQLGWTIIYGIFLSIICMILLSFYMKWIDKKYGPADRGEIAAVRTAYVSDPSHPSPICTFSLILLPVALILVSTFTTMAIPDSKIGGFLAFVGNPYIALFLTVLVTMLVLRKYLKGEVMKVVQDAMPSAASLMIIVGCAGALARVFTEIGLGPWLADVCMKFNVSTLVLAYIACVILRIGAGGSNAVIMLASMLAPVLPQTNISPVLMTLTLCIGPMAMSFHNEAIFWVAADLFDTDSSGVMKMMFWPGTVLSVMMFGIIMLLQQFAHVLPGLY